MSDEKSNENNGTNGRRTFDEGRTSQFLGKAWESKSGVENMRFNKSNYNRLTATQLFGLDDNEWMMDKHGHLTLKEEFLDTEIETTTINPAYSVEDVEYFTTQLKL